MDFEPIKQGILNLVENTFKRVNNSGIPRRFCDQVKHGMMIKKNATSNMPQIKKCIDDAIPEHTD